MSDPSDSLDLAAGIEPPQADAVPEPAPGPAAIVEEPPHPEAEAQRLAERLEQWRPHFEPATAEERWLFELMVVESLRVERCQHDERLLRAERARRARLAWHDDRRLAAEELGRRLGADPSRTARRLGMTAQGCEWLIDRWRALGKVAARPDAWTEAHTKLAFDLLGVPADLRFGTPWDPDDPEAPDASALAARQVAQLEHAKAAVYHELDDAERVLAELGVEHPQDRALAALRRHEAACHRRMLWARTQLETLRDASPRVRPPAPAVVAAPIASPSSSYAPVEAAAPADLPAASGPEARPVASKCDRVPPAIPCDGCDAGLHEPLDWIDDEAFADDDLDLGAEVAPALSGRAPAYAPRNGTPRGGPGG